jgi:predicted Zn-dependent protease
VRATALALVLALAAGHASASEYSEHPRLPDDMRDVAQKAVDDLKAGRYDAAAADYQVILDKYPDSLYAWSNLGVVRSQQDHLDEAVRAFRHAAHLQPNDALVQADLAMCLFEQQKYSDAIPPFERAEKLNPGNSNVHACLARCYEKVGRDDEAEKERQTENVLQMNTYR